MSRTHVLLILTSLVLLLGGTGRAWAAGDEYLILAGDTLEVTVFKHAEFGGTVTVAVDGTIRLPVVDTVRAGGLTLAELSQQLAEGYKKRLLDPEVFVKLVSKKEQSAFIIGAVKKPGMYTLLPKQTSLELLIAAGGLNDTPENTRAVLLRKATGERITLVLPTLLAGLPAANPALEDGDVLMVDTLPRITVYLSGDVEAPGLYEVYEGTTITEVLAKARGIRGAARERRLLLLRGTTTFPIDLEALYRPGSELDKPLQKGDVLRVESVLIEVHLAGEVATPSMYRVKPGIGLAEAMNLAGGPQAGARENAITVTHANGTQEIVDLPALQQRNASYPLQDGDRIRVPSSLVSITVAGEVKAPGTFRMAPQIKIGDVLTLAGGPTAVAEVSSMRLLHADGTLLTVTAVTPEECDKLVTLTDGDRLVVPTVTTRIAVLGNVRMPGYQTLDAKQPFRISEALVRAGGVSDNAAKEASVVRIINGEPTPIMVKLDAVLRKGDQQADILLMPGDLVYVSKKSGGFNMGEILKSLSLFSILQSAF